MTNNIDGAVVRLVILSSDSLFNIIPRLRNSPVTIFL
jgi:hypothetical protein